MMAVAFRTVARKLTGTKFRAIRLAGKAMLAEEVFEGVCREARGTFSFYLSQPLLVKWTRLYRVFYFCQALL